MTEDEGAEELSAACPPDDEYPPNNFVIEWKCNGTVLGYVLVERLAYFPNLAKNGLVATAQKAAFENRFNAATCMLRAIPLDGNGRVEEAGFHFLTSKSGSGH